MDSLVTLENQIPKITLCSSLLCKLGTQRFYSMILSFWSVLPCIHSAILRQSKFGSIKITIIDEVKNVGIFRHQKCKDTNFVLTKTEIFLRNVEMGYFAICFQEKYLRYNSLHVFWRIYLLLTFNICCHKFFSNGIAIGKKLLKANIESNLCYWK